MEVKYEPLKEPFQISYLGGKHQLLQATRAMRLHHRLYFMNIDRRYIYTCFALDYLLLNPNFLEIAWMLDIKHFRISTLEKETYARKLICAKGTMKRSGKSKSTWMVGTVKCSTSACAIITWHLLKNKLRYLKNVKVAP